MAEAFGRIPKEAIAAITVAAVILAAAIAGGVYYFNRGPSTEDVAAFVKGDMQGYFNSDPKMVKYHLTVDRVDLVHTSDTEYKGIATVRANSTNHNVAITVNYDGDKGMWQAERGAFLFLLSG
ncbi:hypothetical protein A5761_15220 [Mycolicibacterium setense]|uniref:hypothetical protein n=1 Tax=Mycolicibacterium setense TaxID=431269 RepID=UPI0007E99226|nr:hypothetical protein [Mycolicibacterium setense]OBB15086.1 hypothetical protein A5761_15220 [Mycolicibacterium setense]